MTIAIPYTLTNTHSVNDVIDMNRCACSHIRVDHILIDNIIKCVGGGCNCNEWAPQTYEGYDC